MTRRGFSVITGSITRIIYCTNPNRDSIVGASELWEGVILGGSRDTSSRHRAFAVRRLTVACLIAVLSTTGCSEYLYQRDRDLREAAGQRADERQSSADRPSADTVTEDESEKSATEDESAKSAATGPTAQEYRGTGTFVDEDAPSRRQIADTGTGEVTLNFVNADIREVVRSILGDTLNANYLIDPKVQGTVTVHTSRPLPRSGLLPMLEEVLRLNGMALVLRDGIYEVLPLQQAPAGAAMARARLSPGLPGRGFGIQIVPLANISAREMANILEPVVPSDRILRVDTARNLLMLGGTQQELATQQELIDLFDVDWLAGMSFAMLPLKSTEAETLIPELQEVFGDPDQGPLAGLVRFVAIERLNAILVIASRPSQIDKAREWVARLDKAGEEGDGQRLHVYFVQNGRAENLAAVLREVFAPSGGDRAPSAQLARGRQRAEIGGRTARETRRAARQARAEGGEEGEAVEAEAPAVQAGTRAAGRAGEAITLIGDDEIRIIADETNNALVILATPRDYRMVEAALRKLDVVPLQVLIEVVIAEVTLTDTLRFGVQWFFEHRSSDFHLTDNAVAIGNIASVFANPVGGFSYFLNMTDFRVALDALDEITDVNVVSAPQLMVLDNQTAEIQVGDQVPITVQQQQAVIGDANIINSVQMVDTGVILRVTPRVNAGGLVIMDIEQEVSDAVRTTTSNIDSPTIQQRRIKTTVAIQSGESVALGGLIRDRRDRTESGIPFLHQIPFLGDLFGATSNTETRTELIVVITPRVIGGLQDARDMTRELRQKMRAVIPLSYKTQ